MGHPDVDVDVGRFGQIELGRNTVGRHLSAGFSISERRLWVDDDAGALYGAGAAALVVGVGQEYDDIGPPARTTAKAQSSGAHNSKQRDRTVLARQTNLPD